ncbi:hypothetical protein BDY24DRAFT_397110 [Mrakia frigida]|uniref:uncharacterized protein n=1 Tax=Mrakia frigida TaxID=29902 RepID=UPI003FCBFD5A
MPPHFDPSTQSAKRPFPSTSTPPSKKKRKAAAPTAMSSEEADELTLLDGPSSSAAFLRQSEAQATERGGRGLLKKLPLEVLDLIFSVDSDLELRDHLSLSGSCVFLRESYRDVVFQVLFQSHHPDVIHPPAHIYVGSDGKVFKRDRIAAVRFASEFGPHSRGWREGRTIFTSSAENWRREMEWEEQHGRDGEVIGEVGLVGEPKTRPRGRSLHAKRNSSLLNVGWPSPWRAKVAELVNLPLITKAEAKHVFGLSDRQLRSLSQHGNRRRFNKSAVSALAIRSNQSGTGQARTGLHLRRS